VKGFAKEEAEIQMKITKKVPQRFTAIKHTDDVRPVHHIPVLLVERVS